MNIVSLCAVSPVVHISNIFSFHKKNFSSFPVAVNNSIKVGPLKLGFLLQMFVITENIMKRPVYFSASTPVTGLNLLAPEFYI